MGIRGSSEPVSRLTLTSIQERLERPDAHSAVTELAHCHWLPLIILHAYGPRVPRSSEECYL